MADHEPRTFFVTRYDLRAPGADPAARQELYARAVEQAAYAERCGQDALTLSEHHAADDGYLPSPLPVAAAFAAVTSRISISIAALLVNLYDPIRLAEDIAVLDHLSGGRVTYTVGLGYRHEEYDLHGRAWESRGRDVEERLRVLLAAWTGEPFEHGGRTVRVTPTPFSRPRPILFYGGGSEPAARRAARLGLHFQPQTDDRELRRLYRDECRRLGREPGMVVAPSPGPATVFCAEDPDAFWAAHGQHLLADARGYQAWREGADEADHFVLDRSTTVEGLRAAGKYVVLSPDELVDRCRAGTLPLVTSHPGCGGMPAEPSWEHLRLIGERVLPVLREAAVSPAP
ncbi:LLM class flavin-dependent oxidoreductase [Nocardioides ferulae]|uniref:LLM class flavin-dependent oxidoreductase n=1 Tax=Nocardioides ferulae TaxID=2340821 RepID=UPI000EAF7B12|nr:LLM class flavin-dependent oxidoreductase [Nocardioides ferulae]